MTNRNEFFLDDGTYPKILNIQELDMAENENLTDVVGTKLGDAETPGFQTEVDPDEAEVLGAFTEDALSIEDAEAAADGEAEEAAFIGDDFVAVDVPGHAPVTNTTELFGVNPGETLEQAVQRSKGAESK